MAVIGKLSAHNDCFFGLQTQQSNDKVWDIWYLSLLCGLGIGLPYSCSMQF